MTRRKIDRYEIMVDIEGLGKDSNAAVLSVGAVVIDTEDNTIVKEAYWVLNWEEQVSDSRRSIDVDTLKWWFSQPKDAQRVIHELVTRLSVNDFTKEFYEFFQKYDTKTVWVNGASYDVEILENLFMRSDSPVTYKTRSNYDREYMMPWNYGGIFCMRSVRGLFRGFMPYHEFKKKAIEAGATAHNALDDARIQANYIIKVREWIKSQQ